MDNVEKNINDCEKEVSEGNIREENVEILSKQIESISNELKRSYLDVLVDMQIKNINDCEKEVSEGNIREENVEILSKQIESISNELKRSYLDVLVDMQIRIKEIQDIIHDIQVRMHDTQDQSYNIKYDLNDVKIRTQDIQNQSHNILFQEQTYDKQDKLLMWSLLKKPGDTYEETKKKFFVSLPKAEGIMKIKQRLTFNYDKQDKLLMWSLLKKPGDTYEETKKKFFVSLPKAEGIMKIKQRLTFKLLEELDVVCKEHGISYWIDFGTLLGAKRHHGFIPWDDDIDLGMMRNDIEKLQSVLENHKDILFWGEYSINVNTCKLVRVMYKNYECPCFIDIFIYDYCSQYDDVAWKIHKEERKKLLSKTKRFKNKKGEITPYSNSLDRAARFTVVDKNRIKKIDLEVKKSNEELKNKIGISMEPSEGIVWGIDNFSLTLGKRIFSTKKIFPLKEEMFEEGMFPVPNKMDELLTDRYGDIYELPADMISHEHLKMSKEEEDKLKEIYCRIFGEEEI